MDSGDSPTLTGIFNEQKMITLDFAEPESTLPTDGWLWYNVQSRSNNDWPISHFFDSEAFNPDIDGTELTGISIDEDVSIFSQADRTAILEFTRPLAVDMESKGYPSGDIMMDKTYWVTVDWGIFLDREGELRSRDINAQNANPSLFFGYDTGTLLGPMWDTTNNGTAFS